MNKLATAIAIGVFFRGFAGIKTFIVVLYQVILKHSNTLC
ncbi:hypothetical protein PULV_b0186 [Pseudoalteromonas ulvae UL12]|nr:hypothetical protein [Pseudoalteromonas ulvae UL12]